MKIFKDTLDFQIPETCAMTLGKFDGIHRGHQKLLEKVLEKKSDGCKTLVFTFGRVPGVMFLGNHGQTILTEAEREEKISQAGIDYLIQCPFGKEIMHMEPEEFVKQILVDRLHVRYLVVGSDFRFGYERKGDTKLLRQLGNRCGFQVEILDKECIGQDAVSSTRIREAIKLGEMEQAWELLGYPYYISGVVIHGKQIGRTLGVPTINLMPDPEKMLPPNGVYLTKSIWEDQSYFGITNIGLKPTVGGEVRPGVETYLFDFHGDLYDQKVKVCFYAFRRKERKFDSLEDLKKQVSQDILWGKDQLEKNMISKKFPGKIV